MKYFCVVFAGKTSYVSAKDTDEAILKTKAEPSDDLPCIIWEMSEKQYQSAMR